MSVNTLLFALVALAMAVSGTPRRYQRDEGIPGGDLGATECRKATIEVWHLPYPGDCTKFIKCDLIGNLSTIYTCDSPLHFNTEIQTCDWPESAGCEGGGSGGGSSSSTSSSSSSTTTTTTTAGSCGPGSGTDDSSSSSSSSSESKCQSSGSSSDDSSSDSDSMPFMHH